MDIYKIQYPSTFRVPLLLSVPHCGTMIPEGLKEEYLPEQIKFIDDTDWLVDQLYDFAPAMGITLLSANVSRWVIDLNRDPDHKPLYQDGRVITALCPVTDFLGNPIYGDKRKEVDTQEVLRRVNQYYQPYHLKIQQLLDDLKVEFGKVLLWDCHSIRQLVPTIRKEKFPDLILGDADGTSASPALIETTLRNLESSDYSLTHNVPFKGGYITRHFGKPSQNQHALQLEMSKVNYMDDGEKVYEHARAVKIRELLKRIFSELIEELME